MRLWGGRFSGETDALMRRFHDSFGFDRRLYAADIRGSVAYATALLRAGLLAADERAAIVEGLNQVKQEFDAGTFKPLPGDEDIHTAVERRLTELIGSPAGKLHTGRSRNDQVALDVRLWLMEAVDQVVEAVGEIQSAIVEKAAAHLDLVMPGYTHLQAAQPVLFSHWLMSTFWMLERDQDRLADCRCRAAVCPLGSGALAGNPFAIDREALAADLGMEAVTPNSMDAVSDRDFIAEFLFTAALIGIHSSRFAEDVVLYTSPGYRFISIGEAYSTGSSLMPQKRNPDSLELARGKAGRLIGDLVGLLTVLKGLPSTYNKDMQEDKEPLFDAFDTLMLTLPVLARVIGTITPHPEAMRAALDETMLATDLADYLVRRGVPFREAHHISGRIVRKAEERDVPLSALTLDDFRAESDVFEQDVFAVLDFDDSVARRAVIGGTAPEAVAAQIDAARVRLSSR
jgi:argininosuccinate lyase